MFGNQVSSIVLDKTISVSKCRKKLFLKEINKNPFPQDEIEEYKKQYKFYSVFYPVGNGIFNIDKSIEDIKWIIDNNSKRK